MEGPGMSLFQGAGSIHINNSAQDRLQEQEELEDQKRREQELKAKLDNAFDDLHDDDEASSVNSSGNFSLDPLHTNGDNKVEEQHKPGPPTYMESMNHLKDHHGGTPRAYMESPKTYMETPNAYVETPKPSPIQHALHHPDDHQKVFNRFGAGDGQNPYYRGHLNGINNIDPKQELINLELKQMYENQVRVTSQLAEQLEEFRAKSDKELDVLRSRLLAAVSDKDKAEFSLQQAHQLLESTKHKLTEQEQQLSILADKLSSSEQQKEELRMELRSATMGLQDAQQRLHTLQVAQSHNTDALFREQQDRHREEVDRLHNDLQKYKSRLDEKENEIKTLERRCKEKDREREELLVEKGATVNRLASELEAAQSKLASGEAGRLKEKVAALTAERNTAREQLKEFGSKLEVTAHELVLQRNKLCSLQQEYDNWRCALQQILIESMPDSAYVGEPPSPGKLSTLKDVLNRYKTQLQKLPALQEEISKRDKKLEQHRRTESELRSELEQQKGVSMQLSSRLAVLQNKLDLLGTSDENLDTYRQQNEAMKHELEEVRAQSKEWELKCTDLEMDLEKLKSERGGRATLVQEANEDLLRELESCSTRLKDALKENIELKKLYLQACSDHGAMSRELKETQNKLQNEKQHYLNQEKELLEKLEKQKKHSDKLTSELSLCREELERANKRIAELHKEFTDKQKEFNDKLNQYLEDEKSSMRKGLESCAQCEKHLKAIRSLEEVINNYNAKLENNEDLIKELRKNSEFFQKYILERFQQLVEQRKVTNASDGDGGQSGDSGRSGQRDDVKVNGHGQSENSDEDEFTAKTNMMLKEKEIREQIAQQYTLEIKTIEMNCSKRIKQMESEHIDAVTNLKRLVETKASEVETLKDFILSERKKVTQILGAKENEISVLIKEHNSLQDDYQQLKEKYNELKQKVEKYQEKYKIMEEKYRSDRENSKRSIGEAEKEKQILNNKLTQLETEYQTLKAKYKNAKKTAYMYKDYVTKKDEHVNSELNRIQNEYREIFLKLENQINYYVKCRVQHTSGNSQPQRSTDHQGNQDYSEVLNRLQSDITALAQTRYEEPYSWRSK